MTKDKTNQLKQIQERIKRACHNANRAHNSVTLIGASKRQTHELIAQFAEHGLSDIGENYLQEAVEKQQQLTAVKLNWHFIGQVQSNKTKTIAENFTWVHGIDRLKIAKRIDQQNPDVDRKINLLIQLNPDNEDSKGGVPLTQSSELCAQISELDNVAIRGFMMIPKARNSIDEQRRVFALAKEQLSLTNQRYGLSLDSLSMGMSNDLEAAIVEGSTMVRIGTALFGARD